MPENWSEYVMSHYGNSVNIPIKQGLGVITITVAVLKAGYVGQVLVDGVIVHELKPRKTRGKAEQAARARVARRLAAVLS